MKTYNVIIDESGVFSKERDHSFVGGFVSDKNIGTIITNIKRSLEKFREKHSNILTRNDIHASELLHPDNFANGYGPNAKRYKAIPQEIREEFINSIASIGNSFTKIKSENDQFDFGSANAQDRYGACLGAFMQKLSDIIPNEEEKIRLNVLIAERNKKCIPQGSDHTQYHRRLRSYIEDILSENGRFIVSTSIDEGKLLLLSLADVICYQMRHNKSNVNLTHPNDTTLNSYHNSHQVFIEKLLKQKEWAAAYRQSTNEKQRNVIIDGLDADEKSQLNYFINLAFEKISTKKMTDYDQAEYILEKILNIVPANNKELYDIKQACISGLIAVYNHKGKTIGQAEKFKQFEEIVSASKESVFERMAKVLELRNRVYNEEFNRYEFDSVIENFEPVVLNYNLMIELSKSENLIENKNYYLLHKIYGTLGQAYAFINDKDNAKKYFELSLEHYDVDFNDNRTVNYFATLYWYNRQPEFAYDTYKKFNNIEETIDKTCLELLKREDRSKYVFDILLLIRLITEDDSIHETCFNKIVNLVDTLRNNAHPMQLIYKHIAVYYLKKGHEIKAAKFLDKAKKVSDGKEAILQSFNLPVLMFLAIVSDDKEKIKEGIADLIENISPKISGFSEYLSQKGGLEYIYLLIDNKDIKAIDRFLPFAYA